MLKYFSPYSFLSDKSHLLEEEHEKPLKTEYIPNLRRDLKPGWLFHHLYNPDTRLKNIQKHILPLEHIPEISFSNGCASSRDKGRQMLELCLDKMLTKGGYISMITRIEYLLDWLLFALGHPHIGELPPDPHSCEGCSMVLYQLFNLFPVMYLPKDYWGSLIADAKSKGSQRHTGYFPTPNTVANAIGQMLFCPEQDNRLQVGCEPTVGTGVMTLEPSNRILCMVATDIDQVLLKATLVNWYWYCPWFAMPPFYLVDRTDLMWGNSLAKPDRENAPVSIHQKYWLEQYRDIYPVGLVEKDWREEIRKIIDLQPAPVTAPKIKQLKIEGDLIQPDQPTKPKGYKRAKNMKKSKSLF